MLVIDVVLDVSLFQLHFAIFTLTRERMLQLHFGEKAQIIGELVTKKEHKAVDINFVCQVGVVPVHLAITTDGSLLSPLGQLRSGTVFDLLDNRFLGDGDFLLLGLQRLNTL